MSFFLETTEMDLGDTAIENIFINDYMPTANGTYVKVYLLGFKYAYDNDKKMRMNNKLLAKHLQISLEDVLNAWDYWEDRGIIEKLKPEGEDKYAYGVKFLSLKQLYIHNTYGAESQVEVRNKDYKKNRELSHSDLIEANSTPAINKMFNDIDGIFGRQMNVDHKLKALSWLYDYNMNPDVIVEAFAITKKRQNRSWININYTESIITNWYDNGVTNMDTLMEYYEENNERQYEYNRILKSLGQHGNASEGQMEIIDKWLDEYEFSMEVILEGCKESARISNPNINYIDGVLTNWNKKGIKTVAEARASGEEYKKKQQEKPIAYNKGKKPNVSNRFHNFEQRTDEYTEDELEAIARRKREEYIKDLKGEA